MESEWSLIPGPSAILPLLDLLALSLASPPVLSQIQSSMLCTDLLKSQIPGSHKYLCGHLETRPFQRCRLAPFFSTGSNYSCCKRWSHTKTPRSPKLLPTLSDQLWRQALASDLRLAPLRFLRHLPPIRPLVRLLFRGFHLQSWRLLGANLIFIPWR